MHGLMTGIAERHAVTAVSLVQKPEDAAEVQGALDAYCERANVVVRTRGVGVTGKRWLQLRSLSSPSSFERGFFGDPALLREALRQLEARRFHVAVIETPYLFRAELLAMRAGRRPALVLDAHNIEYDLVRQVAGSESGLLRRIYSEADWRKLCREERTAWRRCDGVVLTSAADQARVLQEEPGARTAVVPNAVDVEAFRRRPGDPARDGRTILFFGAVNYFPNVDGLHHFVREVWPLLAGRRPELRLKIVGPNPPSQILAYAGERIEVTGFVEDLRAHLAQAAVSIVPLRIGGGTRLKIVEAMAMELPIVSTRLGAEGLDVRDGVDLLLADEPAAFAAAVERILDDPALGDGLAAAGRRLVETRYSWTAAAHTLEGFMKELAHRTAGGTP
jgi:glycosyltransferase involved in cell wall biosynthesis